ncbi:unnamed protein product [Caenorhabditis brenneri]
MSETTISVEELLEAERQFLNSLAMPKQSHPSENVIATKCCSHYCVLDITRKNILFARYHYLKFYNSLGSHKKRDGRNLFLSSLRRQEDNNITIISINDSFPTCPMLFARVFGLSLSLLMDSFGDSALPQLQKRGLYKKSIESLADAIKTISENVQFNSINEIMVPPALSSQLPKKGSRTLPISEIRRKLDVKIRGRENDSLTRCSICFGLRKIMAKSVKSSVRKHAQHNLKRHFKYISQQRVIIRTLCAQSRDKDVDNTVFLIDGMSNRHLKLPRLNDRPKFVTDALRVTMVLTTVQIGEINGANKFSNYDYPGIQNVFSHDSSYILSLFLDGLLKLRAMPSCLTVVLDSAPNNKSYAIIGGMGVILSKIKSVQKIVLLYPSTGHTHLSVDGHFGTLSRSLGNTELMDPTDLISFLENNSSVKDVNAYPTVYDFTGIQEGMDKIQNLCSNSQIILSKDEDDNILWSCASSIHSNLLFTSESDETAFKLFKADFCPSNFLPQIRKPETSIVMRKVDELIKDSGNLFNEDHRSRFRNNIESYGKRAFRQTITLLNQKTRKVGITINNNDPTDPHVTILQYLKESGYPTGRIPKNPIIK